MEERTTAYPCGTGTAPVPPSTLCIRPRSWDARVTHWCRWAEALVAAGHDVRLVNASGERFIPAYATDSDGGSCD